MTPKKILAKIIVNSFLGTLALILINLVGGIFSYHLPFNVVSILITGFLGVPGVVLLIILNMVL